MGSLGSYSTLLLTGYILCFIFLNMVTYLISSFYRNKFNQNSMRSGFLVAIVLFAMVIPSLYISIEKKELMAIFQAVLYVVGSAVSVWNSVILFQTMKKVRK